MHCSDGLSGQGLVTTITDCLKNDLELNISDCRGQAYDGAGAVAGKNKGLSSLITAVNSLALYTHCFSHQLNLSIQKGCSIPSVRDMLESVKNLCYFFKFSPPRLEYLDQSSKKYFSREKTQVRLKDVCRTRWVQRIKGLSLFEEIFVAVYDAIDRMTLELKGEQAAKASSRLKHFTFPFIANLVLTRCIFDITLPVTLQLQSKSIDIFNGISLINALKNTLRCLLLNVEEEHKKWYKVVKDLAEEVIMEETTPRICGRQKHRANTVANTPSEYYRRTITQPLLEYLVTQMSERFSEESMISYYGLSLIPSNLSNIKYFQTDKDWKKSFFVFANFYRYDFPNFSGLFSECDLWSDYWELQDSLPDNITTTIKRMPVGFENIKIALQIMGTLPVTSCTCERSFSSMKLLKNYQRSTMSNDRLNSLSLMYVHQEIVPNIDSVIDLFSVGNRRLDFA